MNRSPLLDSTTYAFRTAHIEDGWITPFRNALAGVSFENAIWKPAPNVASIWELTLHAQNYAENLLNELTGKPRATHADWPKVAEPTKAEWQRLKKHVADTVDALESAVSGLTDEQLLSPGDGFKTPRIKRILDISTHDAYHAGQIVKLKQLYRARG